MKSLKNIIKHNRFWSQIFKLVFSIALILYLFYYVKFSTIKHTFLNADLLLLILGISLLPLNLFVLFKRWELLVNNLMGTINKQKILSSLFHGFAGGLITPLRAGEYFVRKIPLNDFKLKDVMIATFLDKIFLIPPLISIGGFYLIIFLFKKEIFSQNLFFVLIIAFTFLLSAVFFFSKSLIKKPPVKFFSFLNKFKRPEKVEYFFSKFKLLSKNETLNLLLLSILLYFIYSTQFALFIKAMSPGTKFFNCLIISNVVLLLKNFLPLITMGEIGVREAFTIYFVKQFGLAASVGFNAAFIIFVVNLLIPSLIGYFFILFKKND